MEPLESQTEAIMPEQPYPPLNLGWVALLPVVGAVSILGFTVLLVSPFLSFDPATGKPTFSAEVAARVSIPAEALAYAVLLLVIYALLRRVGHRSFLRPLAWNWPRWHKALTFAVAGVALALAITAIPIPAPPNLPIEILLRDPVTRAMFLVFASVPGPLVEEIYFRGLLFPALRSHLGSLAAVLCTALFFAMIHGLQLAFSPWPLASLFLVGVVFTWVRARSGSVASGFLVHAAYNTTLLAGEMAARMRAH
jgi:membrane protease YdiL (CAAX protease family)